MELAWSPTSRSTYGSPLFTRGIRQFETNMDETLDIFHRYRIPVFFSNLVSNLKDQQPFISIPSGAASSVAGGLPQAMPDTANAFYDYTLGSKAWDRGDFATAKQDYTRAKDMDALRFRAPEDLDDIIARLCRKYRHIPISLIPVPLSRPSRTMGSSGNHCCWNTYTLT